MKIKDFSAEKGLTKQAIYKAIQRAGFSTKQLTDRSGNITSKGFSVLRSLFPDPDEQQTGNQGNTAGADPEQQPGTAAELEQLRQRIAELEERCSQWEKRYFEAVETAKQEGQQLRVLLSQEQQLRLAAENKGFFKRLFAGRKEHEEN